MWVVAFIVDELVIGIEELCSNVLSWPYMWLGIMCYVNSS